MGDRVAAESRDTQTRRLSLEPLHFKIEKRRML
jgi:hypothetical protein